MKQVTLKSKVGPTGFTVRERKVNPDGSYFFDRLVVAFTLDNDCRETIPSASWETVVDLDFDRDNNLKYRDVFIPL